MFNFTLRNLSLLIIFTLTLSFNVSYASQHHFEGAASDAGSDHAKSQRRFEPQQNPDNDDTEDTPTELGQGVTPNATFATNTIPHKHPDSTEEEYISVPQQTTIQPKFSIIGGIFDVLTIPHSTMPYIEIKLFGCSCFNPLNPSDFQNNPSLASIILQNSQLNLRHFEEKLGENCGSLTHIDLKGFCDVSVEGQPLITPDRFAQLAHPELLQRILSGKCELLISNPEHKGNCYSLDEMKERFLSSVLQLRSLQKAQDTLSAFQRIIDMLKKKVGSIDPSALATAGVRAAINACTGV